MSLISEKIIEDISVWAKDNENKNIFPYISEDEKTYYVDKDSEETYMMEYSIRTLEELRKALATYGGLSEETWMLKKMTLEICRLRPRNKEVSKDKESSLNEMRVKNEEETLPEFIYVF